MFNKIPKIIHFYWDGSKMPFLCFMSVFSFRKLNPDWIIKIYTPTIRSINKPWITEEQKTQYDGKDYFPHLKDLDNCVFIPFDFEKINVSSDIGEVQKSDFLRWHLLSTEGGVWSDFDIIYFRKINEINMRNQITTTKKENIDFSVCYNFNNPSPHKYSIGFLMAKQDCKFYNKILEKAKENFKKEDYQGAGSQIFNINYPNLINLYESEKESNIWNTSMDILYAYDSYKINLIYNSNELKFFTQNSIGLHFYYGSSLTKRFIEELENNKVTENVLTKVINQFYINANKI